MGEDPQARRRGLTPWPGGATLWRPSDAAKLRLNEDTQEPAGLGMLLYVDDEDVNRAVVRALLESAGLEMD